MADLSQIPTEDLLALKAGDLSKVSTPTLLALKSQPDTTPSAPEDVARGFASGVARGIPHLLDIPAAAVATGAEKLAGDQSSLGDLYNQNMANGVNPQVNKVLGPEYQPQTEAGKMAKTGGEFASTLPIGGEGALLAPETVARAVLSGAGSQAGGDIGQKVGGTPGQLIGSLVGGGVGLKAPEVAGATAGKAAGAVADSLVPNASEPVKALAQRATKDFNIPLSVNQVVPTPFRSSMQKVSQELPFAGVKPFEDTQRAAWNKAVAGTIGESADDLGPDTIKSFLARTSKGFDGVLDGQTIQVAPNDVKVLNNIAGNAKEAVTGDLVQVVQNNVDKFKADIDNGTMSGEKLASLRSAIMTNASRATGGAKEYLNDIVDHIDDIAQRNLGSDAQDQLTTLRRQWRNYKTVEPLLEKATDGQVNPTMLQQRVAASPYIKASRLAVGDDDLVDLARIGKQFLPKLGGSDTTQKVLIAKTAAAVGAAAHPAMAAQGAAALGANRAFQKLYNQNQNMVGRIIDKAPNPAARPTHIQLNGPTTIRRKP